MPDLGRIDIIVKADQHGIEAAHKRGGEMAARSIMRAVSAVLGRMSPAAGRSAGSLSAIAAGAGGGGALARVSAGAGGAGAAGAAGAGGGGALARVSAGAGGAGAAGAAGAAAAGGPAGIAVGAVIAALALKVAMYKKATEVTARLVAGFNVLTSRLASVNGMLAIAQARSKMADILRDMRSGQVLGAPLAKLREATDRLKDSWRNLTDHVGVLVIPALTKVVQFLDRVVRGLTVLWDGLIRYGIAFTDIVLALIDMIQEIPIVGGANVFKKMEEGITGIRDGLKRGLTNQDIARTMDAAATHQNIFLRDLEHLSGGRVRFTESASFSPGVVSDLLDRRALPT